jgi:outer membrane murein-binding lipoprotein Lpp
MSAQPTLQTIAQIVERLANQVDGMKADIISVKDSLTRLVFRVRELEAGVDRLDAGIDHVGGARRSSGQDALGAAIIRR